MNAATGDPAGSAPASPSAPAEALPDLRPHLEALGYRDLAPLSQGQNAWVFRAKGPDGEALAVRVTTIAALARWRNDTGFGKLVRHKLLRWWAPAHPNLIALRATGALRVTHPDPQRGVVRLFYTVMPFVEGPTLEQAFADPVFRAGGPERLQTVWIEILLALAALHARGLRHGDPSPRNVLLEKTSGRAVVIDLRFTTHFKNRRDRDRGYARRLLFCLLSGKFEPWERPKEPLDEIACRAYWLGKEASEAQRAKLESWLAFARDLSDGGRLEHASTPEILQAAQGTASQA